MPINNSKSTKRVPKRHVHGKVAELSLRLACKFSTGKNASHNVEKQKRVESLSWGTRARSERPAAGPEKYIKMLGYDMSKQSFWCLRSSKKLILGPKVRNFGIITKGCLCFYNSVDSKRRELIFTEDQAMTNLNWSILTNFHLRSSVASQFTENTIFFKNARGQVVEQIALSRYYSSV